MIDKTRQQGQKAALDVVVVNHRTPKLFQECLDSLKYLGVDISIYPIDNSPEGERLMGAIHIENKGYGQACNYGVSLGSSPIVLILNADTAVISGQHAIEWCMELASRPDVAAVGPRQINDRGRIMSAGCPAPIIPNGVGYYHRGFHEIDRGLYKEDELDCVYVPGSIFFARRDVWNELGGFLETPLYYEEAWYCYLARHRGYRVVYTGKSLWRHHWDSAPKKNHDMPTHRPQAVEAYQMFKAACEKEGIADIPPFI